MSHISERFSEGYPGTVMAQVAFEVTCDNQLKMEMRCTTSEPTIVNLSTSSYFNLGGHVSYFMIVLITPSFTMNNVVLYVGKAITASRTAIQK